MDRPTKEQIERFVQHGEPTNVNVAEWRRSFADLALQSLSQEAVRDEAQIQTEVLAQLLGAAILRLKELGETSWELPPYAKALALKREPNAADSVSDLRNERGIMEIAEPAPAAPDVGLWLIWSNEHEAWWGPDRCGYPHDITKAGRYSFDEARAICRQRHWEDRRPPEVMICERDIPARSLR